MEPEPAQVLGVDEADDDPGGNTPARHIAATSTPCSVQSPVRFRATSEAGREADREILVLEVPRDPFLDPACAFSQGSAALPTALPGQLDDPFVLAGDHRVGPEIAGSTARPGLAGVRAGGLRPDRSALVPSTVPGTV